MENKIVLPDYKNCIANLPNSILKKLGVPTNGDTLPLLDKYLKKDYKNIVVILLDGMGKAILERHLKTDGSFRSHLAGIYSSTFCSTTVAATTSMMSGLQPCEHAWLGWDCYYPEINENVTVFLNKIQGTETQAADYNVAWTLTPYENVIDKINKAGKDAHIIAPFLDSKIDNFEKICKHIKNICKSESKVSEAAGCPRYIYAYWNQPDGLLHTYGCGSNEAHECILDLEKQVAELADELDDSLVVVTADHGHIDTNFVYIYDYPELYDCLVRKPSLEPRVLNFFIKDGKKDFFENKFKRLFGEKFILMPTEEMIAKNLMGTGKHHKMFRSMLGDYLALAVSNLSIYYGDKKLVSQHGSLTEDEMLIPLIVFNGE